MGTRTSFTAFRSLGLALGLLLSRPLPAQELLFFKGQTRSLENGDSTFGWMLEYLQGVGEHRAVSLSYVNEGHLPFHHRDGNAIQLWGRWPLGDGRLTLSAGAGPYYFYDTTGRPEVPGYQNRHGLGGMGSLAATWYGPGRFLVQARVNLISLSRDHDTLAALLGVGYQLSAPERGRIRPPEQEDWTTGNEFIIHAGSTIVNSFQSELSPATGLEYRRGLGRHVDLSVAWLYEGDNHVIRRNGLATELWAVRTFASDHLALGAGAGAYLNLNFRRRPLESDPGQGRLDGIASLRIAARWGGVWELPVTWHRIITGYDRDTDLFMLGLGYSY